MKNLISQSIMVICFLIPLVVSLIIESLKMKKLTKELYLTENVKTLINKIADFKIIMVIYLIAIILLVLIHTLISTQYI